MHIKLRTIKGECYKADVSKLTNIETVRDIVKREFGIDNEKQRLFFSGKQLEDAKTLFDYNVNQGDVIQVMERYIPPSSDNVDSMSEDEVKTEMKTEDSAQNSDEATSLYFKKGDLVYVRDYRTGAWHDGILVTIKRSEDNDSKPSGAAGVSSRSDDGVSDDGHVYTAQLDVPIDGKPDLGVSLRDVRLCATRSLKFDDLEVGMTVLANYNPESRNEPGFWYETKVSSVNKTRTGKCELNGDVYMGGNSCLKKCRIIFCHDMMPLEPHEKLADRDPNAQEEALCLEEPCGLCKGDPSKECKECCCKLCGGKDQPAKQILCDECNLAYHIGCLTPPLDSLPTDDQWFCPECKLDSDEIVKPGAELKESKKKAKLPSMKAVAEGRKIRDWGRGNATVGVLNKCTIVSSNHFGSIPGVLVGSRWKWRHQASSSGVHRPPVSGIHGREKDGAFSIALSGGYEDDVDNGEEFFYTGSGGRDLSGNKRVATQSFDQTLTKMNLALAMNCAAPINKTDGATAKDWKKGKPVRVVRGAKLAKHSKYAPTEGLRYDGLYKIVKYFPEKGQSGFIVWRYLLRRDDPEPAPWTKQGKQYIEDHGLEDFLGDDEGMESSSVSGGKRKAGEENDENAAKKKRVKAFSLDANLGRLVKADANKKIWEECKSVLEQGKKAFLNKVHTEFTCGCCLELVLKPITLKCKHNVCQECINRSFSKKIFMCPNCRDVVGSSKSDIPAVNSTLQEILSSLFPGYENRS